MKKTLKDVTLIQVGYSFRSRIEPTAFGVAVVQMKDLGADDRVRFDGLQRVEVEEVKPNHLLQRGDLVFRSRGMDMSPALFAIEPSEPILLASPLFRIRVDSEAEVLPEYLNWYLHQDEAQSYLASRTKGTAQKMVSKNSLGELPVDLPNLATQQAIVELDTLLKRELTLLETLSDKRHALISNQLMQLAKGDR